MVVGYTASTIAPPPAFLPWICQNPRMQTRSRRRSDGSTPGPGMDRDRAIESIASFRGYWDVVIIGGGATGLGTAVDAAARGYRTLLLEQSDFAKGTSSRSTKLVHGGVRYLAQGNVALVRAVRETGQFYMLGETTFFRPEVAYCRQRAAEGAFGHLSYGECEYWHDLDSPHSNLRQVDHIRVVEAPRHHAIELDRRQARGDRGGDPAPHIR